MQWRKWCCLTRFHGFQLAEGNHIEWLYFLKYYFLLTSWLPPTRMTLEPATGPCWKARDPCRHVETPSAPPVETDSAVSPALKLQRARNMKKPPNSMVRRWDVLRLYPSQLQLPIPPWKLWSCPRLAHRSRSGVPVQETTLEINHLNLRS